VVKVRRTVEQTRTFDGGDGSDDLVYHFGSPRFGKVGDTFDELSHRILDFGIWIGDCLGQL
jgi:hypothetical protein